VQDRAGDLVGPRTQLERVGRAGAAQVEVAVAQPDVVARVDVVVDRQRQRRGLGEHLEGRRVDLDLAGGQVGVVVAGRAPGDLADDLDAELVAQVVGVLLAEDHLDDPRAVAQVDEDDPAVVAAAGHPAGQRHGRAGVGRAQASGVMGTDHGGSSPRGCGSGRRPSSQPRLRPGRETPRLR
jgi:hypothetical protein